MGGFWQQRTKSEKVLLVAMALVVVIFVPMLVLQGPTANKKLLSAREARQQYQRAESDKRQKDRVIDQLKPEIEKLTYKEAPEEVIPKVIRLLQLKAGAAGIHIREIKPLRVRRLTGVVKVPLSVRFSCDFSRTVPFLYSTEDPAEKLVVDRLNVTAPDSKTRSVDVEAHIAFYTTHTATTTSEPASAAGT
jgi:hypothetical protein